MLMDEEISPKSNNLPSIMMRYIDVVNAIHFLYDKSQNLMVEYLDKGLYSAKINDVFIIIPAENFNDAKKKIYKILEEGCHDDHC